MTPRRPTSKRTRSKSERAAPKDSLRNSDSSADAVAFTRGDDTEIAEALIAELRRRGRPNLVADEGALYGFDTNSGLYSPIPDHFLSQVIQGFAGAPVLAIDPQTNEVRLLKDTQEAEVRRRLRISSSNISGGIRAAQARVTDPGFFAKAPAGIAFADSFVEVDARGVQVRPHAPEHRARTAYPFSFPDDDRTPLYDEFLRTLFGDDDDCDAKIRAIDEIHGAAIVGISTTHERAGIFLGGGDNGKSRLLSIIGATFPVGSVVGIAPQKWGDQYTSPLLVGARLNIVSEMPRADLLETDIVKAVISGNMISARPVGEKAIVFEPRAAHIFAANALPRANDRSPGFERRWLIIRFNHSFTNDPRRDPNITAAIVAAELPQIIRRAMQAAVRLIQNGGYTLPPSHALALAKWRGEADPVGTFLLERTVPAPRGHGTQSRTLYEACMAWLTRAGEPATLSEAAFGIAMSTHVERRRTSAANVYPVLLRKDQ